MQEADMPRLSSLIDEGVRAAIAEAIERHRSLR
jgi:hypothetical protein